MRVLIKWPGIALVGISVVWIVTTVVEIQHLNGWTLFVLAQSMLRLMVALPTVAGLCLKATSPWSAAGALLLAAFAVNLFFIVSVIQYGFTGVESLSGTELTADMTMVWTALSFLLSLEGVAVIGMYRLFDRAGD